MAHVDGADQTLVAWADATLRLLAVDRLALALSPVARPLATLRKSVPGSGSAGMVRFPPTGEP